MQYNKWRILFLLVAILMMAGQAAAATLTVRSDYWQPFNGQAKEIKPGYMIEVLREIFIPLGVTLDYDVMPWEDSLEEVRKGTFDAVIGANRSDAPGFVFPTESFGVSSNMFFVRQGNKWTYQGIPSLKSARLGVIKAYSYSDGLDDYIKAQDKAGLVIEAGGDEPLTDLIRMLQEGKVDVVVEDPSVMTFALLNLKIPLGQVVRAGLLEDKQELFIALSPAKASSKTYAQQFDEGVRKMRSNGRLQLILNRYGLVDWKK